MNTPLLPYFESIDAAMMPFGEGVSIVAQCDAAELEYAAIRKSVALLDGSHRGLVRLTGKDRLGFLHRLLTNDCNTLKPGDVRRAMLLTAPGRILADLLIVHREDETLLDTDAHSAPLVANELNKLLFGEQVCVGDCSDSHHRVSLHGPAAGEVLRWWRDGAGSDSTDFQYDEGGVPGIHIWAPREALLRFAERAAELGEVFSLRFIGWHAWNIARVEAGRAMFRVDFGPDNLPHEAGAQVVAEAVSFTKGCYRGQEIVARMQSRGHPSKRLVGFRVVEGDALPVAGVNVLTGDTPDAQVIGAVTSSTLSPMLGSVPVGLAMVKWGFHEPGTKLSIPAEGRNVAALVTAIPFVAPD